MIRSMNPKGKERFYKHLYGMQKAGCQRPQYEHRQTWGEVDVGSLEQA